MELPPLQKQSLEKIVAQTTRSNGTIDLQQLLNRLPEGTKLHAVVHSVQQLDAKARLQLTAILEKLNVNSTALLKTTQDQANNSQSNTGLPPNTTPSQKPNPIGHASALNNNLKVLLDLIKSPTDTSTIKSTNRTTEQAVFAITLKLMGKSALAFSSTPLSPQQKVSLTVTESKQFVLKLDTQTHTLNQSKAFETVPNQNNTSKTLSEAYVGLKTSNHSSLNQSHLNHSPLNNTLLNKDIARPLITQGLRQHLPIAANVSSTLNTLNTLVTQILENKNIPAEFKEQPLINTLRNLVDRVPTATHVSHASTLKPAVENSGANLENKIRTFFDQRTNLSNENTINLDRDLKAELLKALDAANQILQNSTQNTSQRPLTLNAIDKLLQSLFAPKPSANTPQSSTNPSLQLAQAITPNILAAIARITVLQLRQLSQGASEATASNSGGFMELPIRIGDQFAPLILHIQEKPNPFEDREKEEEKRKGKDKRTLKKRWHIFIEFDLDTYGKFASSIDFCEPEVKTQIWVEHHGFWSLTKKHLQELRIELESNGIEVEELSCIQGQAPQQEMKIDQHLVDIRT